MLVPGRAFGTGEHATTQLCAEQLERCVQPGQHWLDLGCGSGILLLVAREFGVGRALGLEIDPAAVTTATEVLRGNGGHASIEVREGVLDDAPRGCWDGVICNISTVFLRMHLVDLAGLPQHGGLLILSGLLEEDLDEVAARLPAAGLRELRRETRSAWAVLVAERD